MRVVVFANNWLGLQCLNRLKHTGAEIVGLVVHPHERARYRDEIVAAAGLAQDVVFDGSGLRDEGLVDRIGELKADLALSILFGFILKEDLIKLFPQGVVNLHPAFLPYGRGVNTNVWSIVDGTPAGVTMHYVDSGVDTGDIVAQRRVRVLPTDTGESLYRRLEQESLTLFDEVVPELIAGTAYRTRQDSESGSYHRLKDLETIDDIDLDRSYVARDLINILRARTFPPHAGAFIRDAGGRIFLRLELLDEDELDK